MADARLRVATRDVRVGKAVKVAEQHAVRLAVKDAERHAAEPRATRDVVRRREALAPHAGRAETTDARRLFLRRDGRLG